jgi:hypothetical protein
MTQELWNKLYGRCVRIICRTRDSATQKRIQDAWLAVMERRTGTRCFFMTWR